MAVAVVAVNTCPSDANADLGTVFVCLFAIFIMFDSVLAAYTVRKTLLHAERATPVSAVSAVLVPPH